MPITPSKASSGRKRRWNAPPPLTRGTESLEGEQVLIEFEGATGVVLWQTSRNITLWSATDAKNRAGLFQAGAAEARREAIRALDVDQSVRETLLDLTDVLHSPDDTRGKSISQGCKHVADWARKNSRLGTALYFMQAGALAAPRSAALAYQVGLIARDLSQFARAESWFRQSITLGRQTGDWTSYTLAYVGLAEVQAQHGSLSAARRSLIKAMRAARRKGLEQEEALSLHTLQRVSALLGRHGEAEQYAKEAFEAFGNEHPNVSRLALDVARGRVLAGSHGHAMPLLEALHESVADPEMKALLLGGLVRAKAGMADREAYDRYAGELRDLLEENADIPARAQAWLDLAHAAAAFRKWKDAERSASRAAEAAIETFELRVQREAEAVRDAAREGRTADADQLTQDGDAKLDDQLLETIGTSRA